LYLEFALRIIGWTLIVFGSVLTARTTWLTYMYFENMSMVSRQRAYVMLGLAPLFAIVGMWVVYHSRKKANP
jgi:hypothetical protein